jgi:hypothetical protein
MEAMLEKTLLFYLCAILGVDCGQVADLSYDVAISQPTFPSRGPRVTIDEAHRNIHTAHGTYLPFAQLLRNDGYVVEAGTTPLSARSLAGVDLLVVANARQPLAPEECDAVATWVAGGGALLAITDHPPIGERMQPLLDRFGVAGTLGEVWDPAHHLPGQDGSHIVFTAIPRHALTEGVTRVATFTGQGVTGPPGAVAFLPLASTAVEYHPRQVGPGRWEMGDPKPAAPGLAQAVAFRHGKGRVVVTGEAAFLTAQRIGHERFGMNLPGTDNRRLALNVVHWLTLTGGAR